MCFSRTAVFSEALVAELAEALEALVEVSHFLLQLRVLLVQHVLLGVTLQGRDHVLVALCGDKQVRSEKQVGCRVGFKE